ncbi:MAG: anaerobic ribonucleoside-triphosphate reductase activating protein [Lachnospiraceae bacterium]|nr:anaerobic ribonucleoside-triphosphate reductase activating protein [Lachnospiraceae bacterium]
MKYSTIKYRDIANGEGVRNVLFVSGCTHHCKGCFQPQTWDFNYGEEWTNEISEEFLAACEPSYIEGITFLGGEPMEEVNQKGLLPLARELKKRYPNKNIWCYTGYTLEEDLLNPKGKAHFDTTEELLSLIDILVDGEFVLEKKDITLQFRGSSNQRILEKNSSGEWVPWSKKMR